MTISRTGSAPSTPPGSRILYLDDGHSVARGLKDGDPDALAALYDRYGAYVRNILARILDSAHPELEDCMQETFTSAFYRADQLKNPDHLKTWLTRIAINTALDHLRKRKRERWLKFTAPEALPETRSTRFDPEGREAVTAVYRILDTLSPRERVPFVLRNMEKMPLADIAEATGASLATTKRRIAGASERFHRLAQRSAPLAEWLENQKNRRNL